MISPDPRWQLHTAGHNRTLGIKFYRNEDNFGEVQRPTFTKEMFVLGCQITVSQYHVVNRKLIWMLYSHNLHKAPLLSQNTKWELAEITRQLREHFVFPKEFLSAVPPYWVDHMFEAWILETIKWMKSYTKSGSYAIIPGRKHVESHWKWGPEAKKLKTKLGKKFAVRDLIVEVKVDGGDQSTTWNLPLERIVAKEKRRSKFEVFDTSYIWRI
jgi:hypothetical protein